MKEQIMSIVGIPAGGLKTVGQIIATNGLTFRPGQNGLAIALELLSTHMAAAPVIDNNGKYIVFINEFDVLKVLDEMHEEKEADSAQGIAPIRKTARSVPTQLARRELGTSPRNRSA